MKIDLGNGYYLNSDSQCCWVTQEIEIKKGKNTGKLTERHVSGYYRTLSEVFKSFIETKVRLFDAETVEELKDAVSRIEKLTRDIVDRLEEVK